MAASVFADLAISGFGFGDEERSPRGATVVVLVVSYSTSIAHGNVAVRMQTGIGRQPDGAALLSDEVRSGIHRRLWYHETAAAVDVYTTGTGASGLV